MGKLGKTKSRGRRGERKPSKPEVPAEPEWYEAVRAQYDNECYAKGVFRAPAEMFCFHNNYLNHLVYVEKDCAKLQSEETCH